MYIEYCTLLLYYKVRTIAKRSARRDSSPGRFLSKMFRYNTKEKMRFPHGADSVTGFHPLEGSFPGVLLPPCEGVPPWLRTYSGVDEFTG